MDTKQNEPQNTPEVFELDQEELAKVSGGAAHPGDPTLKHPNDPV